MIHLSPSPLAGEGLGRGGERTEADRRRVLDADAQTLLHWSTRLLSARTLEEVFGVGPRPDPEH